MTNVTFPPPVQGPVTSSQAASGIPATLPNPPPPLTQLTVGAQLTGSVVSEEGPGHYLIRTDKGVFPITTRAALELGSQITLQVRTTGPQLHVTITQIDGQPAHLRVGHGPTAAPGQQPVPATPNAPAKAAAGPQPPPAPPHGARSPPDSAAARISGTLSASPDDITALTRAGTIKGFVLADASAGQARVRTPLGTFEVATTSTLRPGTSVILHARAGTVPLAVTLEVDPRLGSGRVTLDAVSGRGGSPSETLARISAQPQAGTQPLPGLAAQAGTNLQASTEPGQRLHAVVRAHPPGQVPGPAAAPSAPAQPPLPIGTVLELHLHTAQPERGPGTTAPVAPPPLGQAPAPTALLGISGQAVHSQAATGTDPVPTHRLEGLVVGRTAQGQPLIQTQLGLLSLESRVALPEGGRVVLELSVPRASQSPDPPRSGLLPLIHSWPALQELLDVLHREQLSDASAAAGQTAPPLASLPQPGARMTSALLFFLAALAGGDATSWLHGLIGEQGREMLQRAARGDLAGRLLQDFSQFGRLAELAGPDWRFLPVPLYDGQQVHQLRLFMRKRRKRPDGDGRDSPEAARFIVEVELSRLGELQLDGLVKGERFDLILRTREALPSSMRRNIVAIFEQARDTAGYAGNIGFQASEDWTPVPLRAPLEPEDAMLA